ncbi:MAG: adenosylcobinamide-GDP ribazoletransferase [Dehalococcoidia bacterium]|nr:MAG: adenosylcobinamide-GDP ribazoletransferase [Dehalococcoidia bacterium]
MMSFVAAWRFLTSVPVPFKREDWNRPLSQQQFARSLVYYPIIGLIIGGILCGLYWIYSYFLPALIADALLLGSLVILTGGLHLDGVVDTFDGLAGGHRSPERRKEIMKEPGVGAIGVVVVVVLLLVKYAALVSVPDSVMYSALILMSVISRWAMVYAVFNYPYAREQGMGKSLKEGSARVVLAIASISAVIIAALAGGWQGMVMMALVWLLTVAISRFFQGKFQGLTGDSYGTINEFSEFAVLLLVVLFSFNNWF